METSCCSIAKRVINQKSSVKKRVISTAKKPLAMCYTYSQRGWANVIPKGKA